MYKLISNCTICAYIETKCYININICMYLTRGHIHKSEHNLCQYTSKHHMININNIS